MCAPELPEDDENLLISAFAPEDGLDLGFGSKTAIGFGRFQSLSPIEVANQQQQHRLDAHENRREFEEAAQPLGYRLLQKVESLPNWGELRQFGEQDLASLDPQEYIPELGKIVREKAKAFGVPSSKKNIPNLRQERLDLVEQWLGRLEGR